MESDDASLARAKRELPGPKYEYTEYTNSLLQTGKLEFEPIELWFWQQCHFVRGRTSVARMHMRVLLRVRGEYALDLKTLLQDHSV